MSEFLYFAYGSNMLLRRLQARCPSAVLAENHVARLADNQLTFFKKSVDGSGKGTIAVARGEVLEGVLFNISDRDATALDKAEGRGYQRVERLLVSDRHGHELSCVSYTALPNEIDQKLVPYDWYIDLIIAGAAENHLSESYMERLRSVKTRKDQDLNRKSRIEALALLSSEC